MGRMRKDYVDSYRRITNTLVVLRELAKGKVMPHGNHSYAMSKDGEIGLLFLDEKGNQLIIGGLTLGQCVEKFGNITVIPQED